MTEEQTTGVDRGQVMLVVLIVLAVIASIVMLFTDSVGALKLALLAALWAAVLGFFLVFRYRREVELLDAPEPDRDAAVLEDIQRELAGIRAQLEELAGREFEYEPAALRAEARRIQELESAVPTPPEPRTGGAPSPDAIAGRIGQQPSRPQANPLADLIREKQADVTKTRAFATDTFQAVPWEAAVVDKQPETSRGRRRRDENEGGLSVAELLARAQKNRGE